MTLNLYKEYLVPDNAETVTYTSKFTGHSFVVANCLRSKVSKEFVGDRHFKDVSMHGESLIFNMWIANFPPKYIPIMGDSFVDAEGYAWVVLKVELTTLRTRWRFEAIGEK